MAEQLDSIYVNGKIICYGTPALTANLVKLAVQELKDEGAAVAVSKGFWTLGASWRITYNQPDCYKLSTMRIKKG